MSLRFPLELVLLLLKCRYTFLLTILFPFQLVSVIVLIIVFLEQCRACKYYLLLLYRRFHRVVIIAVRKSQVFVQVLQVQVLQEILERLVSLLDFDKEFLSMRTSLGACPGADMLLNLTPLLTKQFKGFKETEMFIFGPSTLFLAVEILQFWFTFFMTFA